jgi:hypothetical protein
LPKSTLAVHRVVEASAAKPQLGVEGDTFTVVLSSGRVTATLVGPDVTTQGQYPPPQSTPCTFVLTLTNAGGAVPINPADFTIVDQVGHLYHPQVSRDGAAPPAAVPAGGPITLHLNAVLPTGSGQFRWAAAAGAPIASWDFSVEID